MANPTRKDGVSALLDLGRAYALVEVLRQIDENVPDDLVYMYLYEVDNSGIKWYILDKLEPTQSESCLYGPAVEYTTRRDVVIPKALRNMAKEYMIRCFWDQVMYLGCDVVSYGPKSEQIGCIDRMYPVSVRNALQMVNVPSDRLLLTEIASQINSLHGTLMPNVGSPALRMYNRQAMRQAQYDTLTVAQMRKLDTMSCIARKFIYDHADRNVLPTRNELQLLCNILDIMLMLNPSAKICYTESYNMKQVFEYTKMSATMSERKLDNDLCCCSYHMNYEPRILDPGFKSSVLSTYENLSPHSAICIGKLVRDVRFQQGENVDVNSEELCSWYHLPFRTLLKKINPRPSIAIKLFVMKELDVIREKLRTRSKGTINRGLYGNCACCDEACEPCGCY